MGRIIGLISLLLVLGFATIFLLQVWGVIDINLWTMAKLITTIIVMFVVACCVVIIYAMFFWKGNDRILPGSSKEKAMMDANRKSYQKSDS